MRNTTDSLEIIRNRFRAIGLGATFPRAGAPWTRLGDHVHWHDLIGSGLYLSKAKCGGAKKLLDVLNGGVYPISEVPWFSLLMPIGSENPLTKISQNMSSPGCRGTESEDLFDTLRRIAVRNPSLRPALLTTARADLRYRLSQNMRLDSEQIKKCWALCAILREFGEDADYEFLCQNFALFERKAQLHLLFANHIAGDEQKPHFLRALESAEWSELLELHEVLLRLRTGEDISELEHWINHSDWDIRLVVLLGLHAYLEQLPFSQGLWDLVLPRFANEDDSDCFVGLGWVLGRLLEKAQLTNALELAAYLSSISDKDCAGFYSGMRGLLRTRFTRSENEILLEALDPLAGHKEDDVREAVALVRLHIAGVPMELWDVRLRFSPYNGWLQDLAEPGRNWGGVLGALLGGQLDPDSMRYLCIAPDNKIPSWLRTLWLSQLLEQQPHLMLGIEQAARPNGNGAVREIVAQALLMHGQEGELEPLYLACLSDDLPITAPEDSVRNAIYLLNWQNDPGLEERAKQIIHAAGPICRQIEGYWHSALISNDFHADRRRKSCKRLVELGVFDAPRPLGVADPEAHDLDKFEWSDAGNATLLFGDLRQLQPNQLAIRLEMLTNRELLDSVCLDIGKMWNENPESVLAAWEIFNESPLWVQREAALLTLRWVNKDFLHGRAGERRRSRLLELMTDSDSDVVREAERICKNLEISKG